MINLESLRDWSLTVPQDGNPAEELPSTDQGPYSPFEDPHPGQDGYPLPDNN